MNLFGYSIVRQKKGEEKTNEDIQTFAEDTNEDGALDLSARSTGYNAQGVNFDTVVQDELKLLTKYIDLANQAEIEKAVDDIVNEAFAYDEKSMPVEVNLEECDGLSEKTKQTVRDEFENILHMLNFKNDCYEIFRRWYVTGRLYYHKVIDVKNPKKGIKELRYIDPRKIKKVKEELKEGSRGSKKMINFMEINKKYTEYYVYNPNGLTPTNPEGLKVSPGSITYVHSGILDSTNNIILSHLHEAIKPFNQLRMMEDSSVIYRMVKAPEKRVFNVEIGGIPKSKGDQYMMETINRFTKKIKYDPITGEITDQRRFASIIEDFWFPKRDGKGTTVETLQGGQLTSQMDDIEYFKKKLYEALKVPTSRLESNQAFNIGRASEITRDELKFGKFISRLRKRFSYLFENILGDQLVMKGILSPKEWEQAKQTISFDYLEDNFFVEFKWNEIWNQRITTYNQLEGVIGKYVSKNWVRKNILKISEEEWEEMKKEIDEEKEQDNINMGMDGENEMSDNLDDRRAGYGYGKDAGKPPPGKQGKDIADQSSETPEIKIKIEGDTSTNVE